MITKRQDKAYLWGGFTFAFGMFLGYKWSPDYYEFVNNGNNFLLICLFIGIILFGSLLIDIYYNKKQVKKEMKWEKQN